ncbi:tRNA (adenosine(37)-N6)-dimethylallyltransferase MiaA [Sphingomonas sp. NY01]|uniref:tRNA (adenosine(37)-N6)-dimethylallyltransferase MiaA n=1 Tax=Sphingomonas sp. NY01 TaxID=2968057 RepID=UPI00315D7A6D
MKAPLPKVALIAGPTASGKSALALDLALAHRGTIINADSAQVYRDLRILTARPPVEEEARVPHRLFGHVDGADAGYSAARWASDAKAAIAEALAEDRLPILVGGTGLYLRTLLDGIAPVPAIDASVRAAVRAVPVAQAHAALMIEDPAAAARLNPADTTRVARALEVVRSTGRPLAAWQAHRHGGIADTIDPRALVLLPDRDWLFARINARFADMLATGLEEVAALVARTDLPADAPIRRAIGVPEATALLAGHLSSDEAAAAGALATRRYAKRQYTWFRNQLDDHWHRISDHDNETRRNAADILLRN